MNRKQDNKVITPLTFREGQGVSLLVVLFCLMLTSCGLYNKYERPGVEAQGLIRDAVSDVDTLAVQDTASFGNLPWRQVFTDPVLQQLIEQGLQKNTNLQNAALTVEMYETMLKAAKLAFLPAVSFGANNGMGSISTLYTDPSVTTKAYTLPVISLAMFSRRSVLQR